MRLLTVVLLAAVFAPGCGSTDIPAVTARHVVATTTATGSPEDRAVASFAEDRHAILVHFNDLTADLAFLAGTVREHRPSYMTIVLPAKQLTADAAVAFYEMAAALDADPFADFLYGFVPYDSSATVDRWVKAVRIADFRREKMLLHAATLEPAEEDSFAVQHLPWAANLPLSVVKAKTDAGVRSRAKEIERAQLLLLRGPAKPALELQPESQVVVTSLPLLPLATGLLARGALAVIGGLDGDSAGAAHAEFEDALVRHDDLGFVVKRSWDEAVVRRGDRPLREIPAMTRVLVGDCSRQPFTRDSKPAVRIADTFEKLDASNQTILVARVTVDHVDSASAFAGDRIVVVVPLPRETREASAEIEGDGRLLGQAFERFEDRAALHVVVGGDLRKPNLTVTLNIRRK